MKKTFIALAISMSCMTAPAFAQAVPPAPTSLPAALGGTGLTAAGAAAIITTLIAAGIIIGDDDTTSTTTTTTTTN